MMAIICFCLLIFRNGNVFQKVNKLIVYSLVRANHYTKEEYFYFL